MRNIEVVYGEFSHPHYFTKMLEAESVGVTVKVLGCGKEVGRAAYIVRGDSTSILRDYGVKVTDKTPEFPQHVNC